MPVGSGSVFVNSELLDPDTDPAENGPDPAENGPDPQPCPRVHLDTYGTYLSDL